MKKFIRAIVVILVLAGLGGGGYYYYYLQNNKETDLSLLYQTVDATKGDVSQTVIAEGKVKAGDDLSLYIDSAQTVSKVLVKQGDTVSAGDILIEYDIEQDKKDLVRKLNEAEINLKNAKLNLDSIAQPAGGNELLQYTSDITTAEKNISDVQSEIKSLEVKISQQQLKTDDAKTTMDKNEILLSQGVLNQNDYDASVTAYKNAGESLNDLKIQLEAKEKTLETRMIQKQTAEQKLENARDKFSDEANVIKYELQQNIIQLNQLEIEQVKDDLSKLTTSTISTLDGNVAEVNVTQGGTASKSVPLIRLSDTSSIIAYAEVSEYDVPLLELGQPAEITTSGLPGVVYRGTITKIASEAIEKESSSDDEVIVPVEITIENPDEKLKVGYSVDIAIYINQQQSVLWLPIQAIALEGDRKYVYVLQDNQIVQREVSTGLYGDKTVEIINGLTEGEKVVASPLDIE